MFGAFNGEWIQPSLIIVFMSALAWSAACFVGTWNIVGPDEHRPAIEV